jgi:hypothetical protein
MRESYPAEYDDLVQVKAQHAVSRVPGRHCRRRGQRHGHFFQLTVERTTSWLADDDTRTVPARATNALGAAVAANRWIATRAEELEISMVRVRRFRSGRKNSSDRGVPANGSVGLRKQMVMDIFLWEEKNGIGRKEAGYRGATCLRNANTASSWVLV